MISNKIHPPKVAVPSSGIVGSYTPRASISLPAATPNPNRMIATQNFRKLMLDIKSPAVAGAKLPSKSHPAPKTLGDVVQNMMTADRLVKAGVFKTGPDLKTVTRDALVNATVNGLVSTPLSIGTYAGSVWSGEHIKGAFSANTPLLPPAHQPAPSQQNKGVGVTAGEVTTQAAQDLEVRLENTELKLLLTANAIQSLAEGSEGQSLGISADWPTEPTARLDNMEKLYDAMETSLKALAEKNDFIFRPYKDDALTKEKSTTSRLDVLDKRNERTQAMMTRIFNVLDKTVGQQPSQIV